MNRKTGIILAGFFAFALFLGGCETMGENTKRGAAGGALLGSVAGGVIGHQSGHGVEGALIGAGVGALGGGLIGDKIDSKEQTTTAAGATTGEKLGLSDVIALSKAGLTDAAIISKINATGSVYRLSVEEIEMLRKEGVSATVVNYMLETGK
ncbi:MAG: YMGG-like glycine zipper-containing protein [Deltaproteobacteria bacterium]